MRIWSLPGQFTSHLAELQKAAKAAQEKELRQGGHFTLMRQAGRQAVICMVGTCWRHILQSALFSLEVKLH